MTINTALQDWIIESTGYDDQHVIVETQDGPRPIGNYATYDLVTVIPTDYSSWKKTDLGGGDIQFDYINRNVLMVSVNIYDPNGMMELIDLFKSRYTLAIKEILKVEEMSLIKCSEPAKINEPGDSGWRNRYQADFEFLSYHTLTEIIEQINAYSFTGKFIRDPNVEDTVAFDVP